jgi:hypothetical protein
MNRSIFAFSFMALASSSAWAAMPKIAHFLPAFPLVAGQRTVTEGSFDGTGFWPGGGAATDLEAHAELNYRRISPTLGPWLTALWHGGSRPTDDNSPIEITSIGDTSIRLRMFEGQVMHPGAWAFSYCLATVGCSESFVVTIQDGNAALDLNTRVIDLPVMTGDNLYTIDLSLSGMLSLDPQLVWTISSAQNPAIIPGTGYLPEGRARFQVGARELTIPGLYTIQVYDKVLGINSSNGMARVFGTPKISAAIAPIVENLSALQPIQDTSVKLQFAPFTVPTEIDVTDSNGANHVVNPPVDLLSNSVELKIPAAWLKLGTSKLVLNYKNIAGEGLLTYLPVTVNKPEIHPIPHPTLVPLPIPPIHP